MWRDFPSPATHVRRLSGPKIHGQCTTTGNTEIVESRLFSLCVEFETPIYVKNFNEIIDLTKKHLGCICFHSKIFIRPRSDQIQSNLAPFEAKISINSNGQMAKFLTNARGLFQSVFVLSGCGIEGLLSLSSLYLWQYLASEISSFNNMRKLMLQSQYKY